MYKARVRANSRVGNAAPGRGADENGHGLTGSGRVRSGPPQQSRSGCAGSPRPLLRAGPTTTGTHGPASGRFTSPPMDSLPAVRPSTSSQGIHPSTKGHLRTPRRSPPRRGKHRPPNMSGHRPSTAGKRAKDEEDTPLSLRAAPTAVLCSVRACAHAWATLAAAGCCTACGEVSTPAEGLRRPRSLGQRAPVVGPILCLLGTACQLALGNGS